MEPHYEFLEHTADILVKGYGPVAGRGVRPGGPKPLFAVITDSAPVTPDRQDTLHTDSIDLEGLLIEFLSDLIVVPRNQQHRLWRIFALLSTVRFP